MNGYEFFKAATFDENGNLLVSGEGGSGTTYVFTRGLQSVSGVVSLSNTYMTEYSTANRPEHDNGLTIIDTDLGYPIYSDGTNWRNFTGEIV